MIIEPIYILTVVMIGISAYFSYRRGHLEGTTELMRDFVQMGYFKAVEDDDGQIWFKFNGSTVETED